MVKFKKDFSQIVESCEVLVYTELRLFLLIMDKAKEKSTSFI